MSKKFLSLLLALTMVMSLFAGLTVTASADYEGTGTFTKATGTLSSGYYVFGCLDGTELTPASGNASGNWILPGADITVSDSALTDPATDLVWYFDAAEGTLSPASNPSVFLYYTGSKNTATLSATATPVVVEDNGDGVYTITMVNDSTRTLRLNGTSGWRFYASTAGNGNFAFFKLSDSSAPVHEHVWGDWTSNDNGTHSRTCAGTDCPIGTQTENCSFDEGTVTTEPTCVDTGVKHFTCTVCGYEKDETIPATGEHVDADHNGACDVCGEEMPTATVFTLGTEVHEGDQVVIYYPAGSLALSVNASGTKLAGTAASVSGEELTVLSNDTNTAVLTVEFADATNFYLKTAEGKYLTTPSGGNGLSFAAEASDYALWYLEVVNASAKTVYIRSTNAAYNGNKNQALEYYNGFTVYGIKTNNSQYLFQLFILANPEAHVHDWDEGTVTTEPSCTSKGVKTFTCSGCDETYTEEIPMIAHVDADGDGLCDTCQGTIYNQAETLNDGDSAILVTTAFGKAMTGTASGKYMAAAEVNAQAGVTVPVADDNVWTVKTADEGFYLLNADGQYLYVTEIESKYYLALGDETAENRIWKIADPVDGLTATGAYLVNEGGKYIEYGANYGNYQTYSAPNANYETWYAFSFYTLPKEPDPIEDGFYLIGPSWTLSAIDPEQKFETNPNNSAEYLLQTTLQEGDEIKVVRVENNAITGWWPDGENTQYHVDAAHSGDVTIYFKTDYVNDWSAFGGYFYIGEALAPVNKVAGYSVSTTGTIGLNVYLQLTDEMAAQEGVTIVVNGVSFDPADVAVVSGDETYYKVGANVAAKDAFAPITVQLLAADGSAVTLYKTSGEEIGETFEISVADYLTWQAENSEDEVLLRLVKSMYNYCACAAAYFGSIEELPALYEGDDLDVNGDIDLGLYEWHKNIAEDTQGFTYKGVSLLLKTDTTLRVYFSAKDLENAEVYLCQVGYDTDDAQQIYLVGEPLTPVKSGSNYYVEITNISAKDLDEIKGFTIRVVDGENVTHPITVGNLSALGYAYAVQESSSDENLLRLVHALYRYNQAANEYFEG